MAFVVSCELLISHATREGAAGDQAEAVTWTQVATMFNGFRIVEPGIVYMPQWRPSPAADDESGARPERATTTTLAAVGIPL